MQACKAHVHVCGDRRLSRGSQARQPGISSGKTTAETWFQLRRRLSSDFYMCAMACAYLYSYTLYTHNKKRDKVSMQIRSKGLPISKLTTDYSNRNSDAGKLGCLTLPGADYTEELEANSNQLSHRWHATGALPQMGMPLLALL